MFAELAPEPEPEELEEPLVIAAGGTSVGLSGVKLGSNILGVEFEAR